MNGFAGISIQYSPIPDPEEFLAITSFEGRIRVVKLLRDGSYNFVNETPNPFNIFYSTLWKGNGLRDSIEEYEYLINSNKSTEQDFQNFFTINPDFILSDEYRTAHPHITLERTEGDLIPDFLLEPHGSNLCDILEIKKPNSKLFTFKKNRPRFSSSVFEGVAQLREYQRYFDQMHHVEKIKDKYGITAYKPRLFLIIGKKESIDNIVYKSLKQDFNQITLRTYDEILTRMKYKLNV